MSLRNPSLGPGSGYLLGRQLDQFQSPQVELSVPAAIETTNYATSGESTQFERIAGSSLALFTELPHSLIPGPATSYLLGDHQQKDNQGVSRKSRFSDLNFISDIRYSILQSCSSLGANPTVAQMKLHKERRTRKAKAKACLFAAVSPSIFIKIMKIDSAAEIWEYLKEEYKGDERIKNMQVMNLIREFEMKKMRESDAVKDYAAQLLSISDKVRLLGKEFSNEKIVQKILVTLPEKYEATISSLENSKDLSTISLTELLIPWRLWNKEDS
ncbi:hypothetical protein CK203_064251 [Vitis vinifera]|uniref:Retrovirus-related Pol polyprotein from transposon RE1 n=1 Tax=Vitis vinifera TaxID=29760 RepID=A0A438G3U0_VITVI|nr:hypothetical protein CK203_064251 [Vitis vinifera]